MKTIRKFDFSQPRRVQSQLLDSAQTLKLNAGQLRQAQFERSLRVTFSPDDVQFLQLTERFQRATERRFILQVKAEITETQTLQVGENRSAERVEERLESGGADEVLSACTADPPTLSPDEPTRTLRIAQTLHSVVVDLYVAAS